MRQSIYLSLLLICRLCLYGQDSPAMLPERVYLQTDKQLYLAGEVIWIKALTTTPERIPLSFSKLAYVELLDETSSLQQIKIGLSEGVGEGSMRIPANTTTGCYRLTGYTRQMCNEGPAVFFETTIGIVNTFQPVLTGSGKDMIPTAKRDETPKLPVTTGSGQTTAGDQAILQDAGSLGETITIPLSLNKQTFTKREAGWLQIDGLPADVHTLSVAITGKSSLSVPGSNGLQQWCKQVKPSQAPLLDTWLPEYEGHIVTGKLVALDGSTEQEAEVSALLCIPGEQLRVFAGKRNGDDVTFYLTDMTDATEIITTTISRSNNYRLDIQPPFIQQHTSKQLPPLTVDSTHLDELLKRSVALQLLPGPVKAPEAGLASRNKFITIEPNRTYRLDDYTRFPKMDELILEFVLGVRFRMREGKREIAMAVIRGEDIPWITPLVLLDGIPVKDHELIYQYNPLLVEKIDVYLKEYLFGGIKQDGIIAFTTYTHKYSELKLDNTYQLIDYAGTQAKQRPYYSDNKRQPDLRHTLLWNPAIQTAGSASLIIPFHTSDYTGDFVVTVEGLTKTGKPVYATLSFVVE